MRVHLDVSSERAQELAGKLAKIERTVSSLTEVQKGWLYLMPVFASEVLRALQAGERFVAVDRQWREAMATLDAHQGAVAAIDEPSLAADTLARLEAELEQIQRDLSAYLEERRFRFPRFYFLSNEELYSILAKAESPLLVQPVRARTQHSERPPRRNDCAGGSPEPAAQSQLPKVCIIMVPAFAAPQ